ncbi:MAG: hypothetical protein KF708_08525 [Pirellulales bacterium]|nr:hypothetical protein [Pirellulales bacterium]
MSRSVGSCTSGPGDLLGTKQHGIPAMWIADLKCDSPVLEEARRDALALVERDPGIALPEHARLRKQMITRYGRVWGSASFLL